MIGTKRCHLCSTTKPLTEFYKNRARDNGASVYCIDCSKRKWAIEHPKTLEALEGETFKAIPGYESFYEASSFGRIRSAWSGRVRVASPQTNGYLIVGLSKDGNVRTHLVHKLIAITFIGPRPAGLTINHIDGDKVNNRPENLEYCTQEANDEHAARLGLKACGFRNGAVRHPERLMRGEQNHKTHFTTEQVLAIRVDTRKITYIARDYGCSRSTVNRIKQGLVWKHV
jgi:NUMOD4 motif./HNH endonuclease.